MGKKRNSAKTGDKAIYKRNAEAREATEASRRSSSSKKQKSDPNMYNDVDAFHNEQDHNFLNLERDAEDDASSESDEGEEAVMDLGVGGESSTDDGDDDSDSDDDEDAAPLMRQANVPDSESSDDDDGEEGMEDVRDWGRKKSDYYHGDTADLELGQDEEDAFLEEEAAKEVQAARYEEMDEDDFALSDDDDSDNENTKGKGSKAKKQKGAAAKEKSTTSKIASIRDVSKLSKRDRHKLLEKQHPGLLQILSHFSEAVQDLTERTSVATGALFSDNQETSDETAEAVGTTTLGKKYLLTKALIQSTTALNLAMFLLLKSKESSEDNEDDNETGTSLLVDSGTSSLVQFHPVMKRLQEFNVLNQKMKSKVEDNVVGLDDQLENLIKAAKLMESMAANPEDESGESSDEEHHDDDNEESVVGQESIAAAVEEVASSSSDNESSVDEEAMTKTAAQNARFGLRPNEVAQDASEATRKRRRRAAPSDLGDDENGAGTDKKSASKYLSSALNTIEQRAASKKKKKVISSEALVDHKEVESDVRRGVEMMEAELDKASDQEGYADDMPDEDPEGAEDGEDGFYSKVTSKSKAKKAFKKSLYKVAPKYPRMEREVEGERAISRTIMKNRGLVAHKNKLNRNPRVKKREQYRKALIKRKGSVREVRTDEGHKYGGEETGIKRGISRSRKLGTN